MNEVEKKKHAAAASLQKFVNKRIEDGVRTQLRDPEAMAVVEKICEYVVVQFHDWMEQVEKERVGNGK